MKSVLLDRDGVICYNRADHVKCWSEFRFLPGATAAIAELTRAGYRVAVLTNQSIINRGLVPREVVDEIHARMIAEVAAAGGRIEFVAYCPHRPDECCPCRKPQPGLVLEAGARLGVHWDETFMVGDHWTDLQAGKQAGCRTVLVLTGRGLRSLFEPGQRRQQGFLVSRSLKHSVKHILHAGTRWPSGPAARTLEECRGLMSLNG